MTTNNVHNTEMKLAEARTDEIKKAVYGFLKQYDGLYELGESYFNYDIYAGYDDRLSDSEAASIIESVDPVVSMAEILESKYDAEMAEVHNEIVEKTIYFLEKNGYNMSDADWETVKDLIFETVCFTLPEKHFLTQEYNVDLLVDTGDGNFDYTLNCVLPAYGGAETIDPKASLVTLACLQGYTHAQLQASLLKDRPDRDGAFLDSVRWEVVNETSNINALVVLARMTLEDTIRLNRMVKKAETGGYESDPSLRTYPGTITIRKDAMCGLFDLYGGGGSTFEIRLEKNMDLPVKYVRKALPDSEMFTWSIEDVYGMSRSAWIDCVIAFNYKSYKEETNEI